MNFVFYYYVTKFCMKSRIDFLCVKSKIIYFRLRYNCHKSRVCVLYAYAVSLQMGLKIWRKKRIFLYILTTSSSQMLENYLILLTKAVLYWPFLA